MKPSTFQRIRDGFDGGVDTRAATLLGTSQASFQGFGAGTVYVVQAGDTLSSIARRFGTTVQAIAQANGIANPNWISIGQRLTISPTPTGSPWGSSS